MSGSRNGISKIEGHLRDVTSAAQFAAKHRLWDWVCQQNMSGVAPTRRLLISAYVRAVQKLPAELPCQVRSSLRRLLHATPRFQRKWLRSFRQQFATREVLTLREMQMRVEPCKRVFRLRLWSHFRSRLIGLFFGPPWLLERKGSF